MQQHIQTIVQHFFDQPDLDRVNTATLEQVIEKYPYMGIGHWLLARKTGQVSEEHDHALTASLYTQDPSWLLFSLNAVFPAAEPVEERSPSIAAAPPEQQEEEITEEEITVEEPAGTEQPSAEEPAEESVSEEEAPLPATEPEPVAEALSPAAPVSIPLPALQEKQETEISFEPYHTIDYFASQGIKLTQEDLKDKLGMQLKSFTEWLRAMKRIVPSEQEQDADPEEYSQEHSASPTDHDPEIATETMAEVWAKQGYKQKAIAIYEKLSLQNPAKNTYFAKKIEQLNRS